MSSISSVSSTPVSKPTAEASPPPPPPPTTVTVTEVTPEGTEKLYVPGDVQDCVSGAAERDEEQLAFAPPFSPRHSQETEPPAEGKAGVTGKAFPVAQKVSDP